MSSREIITIMEELRDLRTYLRGLPKHLVDSGAFVAYEKRETLLQEELIAAQLYNIVGEPESQPDPSQGLRQQVDAILNRITEFQEKQRRLSERVNTLKRELQTFQQHDSIDLKEAKEHRRRLLEYVTELADIKGGS